MSCTKLTMIKFIFRNDLTPNYPNSFYCKLPWPNPELMFRVAGLRKPEPQELEAPAALWALLKGCSCPHT